MELGNDRVLEPHEGIRGQLPTSFLPFYAVMSKSTTGSIREGDTLAVSLIGGLFINLLGGVKNHMHVPPDSSPYFK